MVFLGWHLCDSGVSFAAPILQFGVGQELPAVAPGPPLSDTEFAEWAALVLGPSRLEAPAEGVVEGEH